MGDRANIVMHYDDGGKVYFYTHNGGRDLAETLQSALTRGRDRWDDPQYLSRVIFCEMIQGNVLGETGFGISPTVGDNSYAYVEVHTHVQIVRIGLHSWGYEQYTRLAPKELRKLYVESEVPR